MKAVTTLGEEISQEICLSSSWFGDLWEVLSQVKVFLRMCWLKTIAGGWCTTCRMNEPIIWPCIFGCDAKDELQHYSICPILWHLAFEKIGHEQSVFIGHRLCLVEPSVQKLRTLAFVHFVYHSCKFDQDCIGLMNAHCENLAVVHPRALVRERARGFARVATHWV